LPLQLLPHLCTGEGVEGPLQPTGGVPRVLEDPKDRSDKKQVDDGEKGCIVGKSVFASGSLFFEAEFS